MTTFDRTLLYQFVAFTDPPGREVPPLGGTLEAKVEGVDGLGLKLRPSGESFSFGQSGAAVRQLSWTAASDVWRINWSPERLDATFNARGYAEVREADVASLQLVRRRLADNLLAACEITGQQVTRLAVVVTGETSCPDRNIQDVIAGLFFNEEIKKAAAQGTATDLIARTNLQDRWTLDGRVGKCELTVNRIQTLTAVALPRGKAVETYLTVQIDANSAASFRLGDAVDRAGLLTFMERAEGWVSQRLKAMEAACSR
jgi:hypothetical protein